jgi:predicted membrane protein (TIGR00267 family)
MGPAQLDELRRKLGELPEPAAGGARLSSEDWRGALAVLLLVFTSTLPVVVPFLLVADTQRALRLSNAVAITMLFVCGYSVGRMTGHHPWRTGLSMVVLGAALAAMTMALGG